MNSVKHNLPAGINKQRKLIGWFGIALPFLVLIIALIFPFNCGFKMLDSISAFYFTSANTVFVGILSILAFFLFTYNPKYEGVIADRNLGLLAGISALGVAFFPTKPPCPCVEPIWWYDELGIVHFISAIILFVCFAIYSLWLFVKSKDGKDKMSFGKKNRNWVYRICGVTMLLSVIWTIVGHFKDWNVFLPEALALIAFSISWLVKGGALNKTKLFIKVKEKKG